MAKNRLDLHPNDEVDIRQPPNEREESSGGGFYEIVIEGHLDEHWSEWLGDLKLSYHQPGNTQLTGFIPDQAALHGILIKIRDLGLILISLTPQSADVDGKESSDVEND